MHPRLLKTFLAVARSRSFTRAADEVHLAQSSVSDQMQSLEAELGTALVTRSKQGLELTQAGETLVSYAQEILALTDEARSAVAATAGHEAGSVSIGALETIAAVKLPAWLSAFQSNHPDINLRLKVAGSGDLLRKLETGEIDVAFCFDHGGLDARFVSRVIATEPLILATPPAGKFAAGKPDLAELAAMDFLTTEVGCAYRAMFDKAFAEAGMVAPKPAAEVGSIGAIARLVTAGAGIGLVPRLAVAEALDRGEIIELPWPGPTQVVSLVTIWRWRRVQPPALLSLLAAASDHFAPARSADVRPRHARSSPS
ncbi:LysR family transcriptional regulator [Rhizobium rhizogenes]|uniref:LysR family transcriptional regulator n=1 Tax=Rhizobium rhizogenes TaxID=359 RepID=UPI0024BE6902|nr:LysR family transcriptional regulator [Rhizobium rhizogenes]MDJ1637537.1 LysR family transcriptional regulator [Rhizobium rhizogenes]